MKFIRPEGDNRSIKLEADCSPKRRNQKELQMDIKQWEPTIEQILVESNQQQKESGKNKVLTAWRAKLEKEPTSLPLYKVDAVVREVRRRLDCLAK